MRAELRILPEQGFREAALGPESTEGFTQVRSSATHVQHTGATGTGTGKGQRILRRDHAVRGRPLRQGGRGDMGNFNFIPQAMKTIRPVARRRWASASELGTKEGRRM